MQPVACFILEIKLATFVEMSVQDRAAEAMRRSMKLLPADAAAVIQAMLTPESLAIGYYPPRTSMHPFLIGIDFSI